MSEPLLPLPPPEGGEYWDPAPARCEECGSILQNLRPVEGEWTGWCPTHDRVPPYYPDSHEVEEDAAEE